MSDFPPTGQWTVYSVQKTIPVLSAIAPNSAIHNYIALVDPSGNIQEELHGGPARTFTGNPIPGNYLVAQKTGPNGYDQAGTI